MAVNSLCSPTSSAFSSALSRASSAASASACDLTDTYSPAAMDMAPATRPATPATMTLPCVVLVAATPSSKLEVDRIPSFAPNTAARNQPACPRRWRSVTVVIFVERLGRIKTEYLLECQLEIVKRSDMVSEAYAPHSPAPSERTLRRQPSTSGGADALI